MVNVDWPTAVAGEADIVSSVSASACHIGRPIGVNPGQLKEFEISNSLGQLAYGNIFTYLLVVSGITSTYLCPTNANVYNIDFVKFKIRDVESGAVLFEIAKPPDDEVDRVDQVKL